MSTEAPDSDKEHDSEAQSEEYPWRNKELLRELYVGRGMSVPEIADEFGWREMTVYGWMERHGIPRQDKIEAMAEARKVGHAGFYTDPDGYELWHSGIPGTRRREQAKVHRLLAVSQLGIDAVRGKHVHHKNGIPWDNRAENLEVLSASEHTQRHWKDGSMGGATG